MIYLGSFFFGTQHRNIYKTGDEGW